MTSRVCGLMAVLGGALVLAGCAGDQSATSTQQAPRQGARWETIFLPQGTEQAVAQLDPQDQWWDSRRDAEMAVRIDGPLLATEEWPEAQRASLSDWRYLTLPQQSQNILYFEPGAGGYWPGRSWPDRYGYSWRRW